MQGGQSKRDRLRGFGIIGPLLGGLVLGGVVLGAGLAALGRLVEPRTTDEQQVAVVLVVVSALALGDLWAVAAGRLYPLGLRRQARAPFALKREHRDATVGFTWGLDAGLGVTTYRVTSGVWVFALLVGLGLVDPRATLLYPVGFGLGLFALVTWPVTPRQASLVEDPFTTRIARLAAHRRHVQVAYLMLLLPTVLVLIAEH